MARQLSNQRKESAIEKGALNKFTYCIIMPDHFALSSHKSDPAQMKNSFICNG